MHFLYDQIIFQIFTMFNISNMYYREKRYVSMIICILYYIIFVYFIESNLLSLYSIINPIQLTVLIYNIKKGNTFRRNLKTFTFAMFLLYIFNYFLKIVEICSKNNQYLFNCELNKYKQYLL